MHKLYKFHVMCFISYVAYDMRNNQIKTDNFSSQQQKQRPNEKCKTGTLRTYNTI